MACLTVHVDQVPIEGLSRECELDPSWFSLPPEAHTDGESFDVAEPIRVSFLLERSGRDFRTTLTVSTKARVNCSRCLNDFLFDVNARTQFTFCRILKDEPVEKEIELDLEDMESGLLTGDEIDLSELVYEQIVLSIPIKPLCKEGCKGLCPMCGADRNVEDCKCKADRTDPRWDALKKLKIEPKTD